MAPAFIYLYLIFSSKTLRTSRAALCYDVRGRRETPGCAERRPGAQTGAGARVEEPGRAEPRIDTLLFMIVSTQCRVLMPHSITEKERWNLDATDVVNKKKKGRRSSGLYH